MLRSARDQVEFLSNSATHIAIALKSRSFDWSFDMITAAEALRAQLDDINRSLAAPESEMMSLRAQKERLLTDLDSLQYPVLTLPNEITVEIFLHFVSLMRQEYHRLQPYHGLLILASVCQTWRAVTLLTPALWNDGVQITCGGIRDASKLLEACLPRAGSLPLDLDIQLPADVSSTDMIISILILYGSQWRRIHLSSPVMWHMTFPIPISSLPLLECLRLSNIRADDNSVSPLCHAPQLRELRLRNSSWAIQLGLPFNRLTKLDLFPFSITQLLAVLPYTLNLEYLQLASYATEDTEDTQVVPLSILLPHLHTFVCNEDLSTMVLQYLTLPALERLMLLYLSNAGVHEIQLCVARSLSTIRIVSLIYVDCNAAYDLLCSLPTIRHFSLSWDWSNDDEDSFFAALISGSCLPALESLLCEDCQPTTAATLFAVVSARWQGVEGTTKLSSVSLDFAQARESDADDHENVFNPVFDQLYELRRQGLNLEITGAPDATR